MSFQQEYNENPQVAIQKQGAEFAKQYQGTTAQTLTSLDFTEDYKEVIPVILADTVLWQMTNRTGEAGTDGSSIYTVNVLPHSQRKGNQLLTGRFQDVIPFRSRVFSNIRREVNVQNPNWTEWMRAGIGGFFEQHISANVPKIRAEIEQELLIDYTLATSSFGNMLEIDYDFTLDTDLAKLALAISNDIKRLKSQTVDNPFSDLALVMEGFAVNPISTSNAIGDVNFGVICSPGVSIALNKTLALKVFGGDASAKAYRGDNWMGTYDGVPIYENVWMGTDKTHYILTPINIYAPLGIKWNLVGSVVDKVPGSNTHFLSSTETVFGFDLIWPFPEALYGQKATESATVEFIVFGNKYDAITNSNDYETRKFELISPEDVNTNPEVLSYIDGLTKRFTNNDGIPTVCVVGEVAMDTELDASGFYGKKYDITEYTTFTCGETIPTVVLSNTKGAGQGKASVSDDVERLEKENTILKQALTTAKEIKQENDEELNGDEHNNIEN